MSINFNNIFEHVIPMDDFRLKWRFTEETYDKLPDQHLEQIKPLSKEAAKFLNDYIGNCNLHANTPFKRDFFRIIDKAHIFENNEKEIKKWLYQRGLPFEKIVFLSYNETDAIIVPWKILIKYYTSFYYSVADDLTVFDQSLTWSLLFYHESEIYFGTNEKFEPSNNFEELEFCW
jgi:hypothetical protein